MKNALRLVSFTILLLVLSTQAARAASVRFVIPSGATTGACNSWASACDLPYALNSVALSGDEIWVKTGTHTPGNARPDTFQLKNGVALYGGFTGTEISRDQRNWTTNVTTLSGEIGAPGISDNTYHILTGGGTNSTAVLDGFTVSGGNADAYAISFYNIGGGMFNDSGSPTVRNVIFSGNSASYEGGGMFNWHGSSPTLTNVTFIGNTSTASPSYGGGMMNYTNSNPTLTNVTFSDNSAHIGGGMSNTHYSNPTLINVTFSGNSAAYGGGMHNWDNSNPTLTNVTFKGNTASGKSDSLGGAIANQNNSNPTIRNSILWGNTALINPQVSDGSGSFSTITFSDIQGGCPTGSTCTNIISGDPLLGALGNYGGNTPTIPFLPGSAAIDAADDSICPLTDQRGVTRPQGAHCDMGAFEFVSPAGPTPTKTTVPPGGQFTFTAAGDYGATTDTAAVLNGIASAGASFHLAVGDLSYGKISPESAWCDFVKSKVGASFPFELVSGNHEDGGENPGGGLIDNFLTCLPNRINPMVGTYGKEYYFDYPEHAPLARLIMLSPNLTYTYGGFYDYTQGTAHYNWVASTIDQARSAGIKWIVVGMHKTCISMGSYPCNNMDGTGPDILNLLVSKKVDLILQGHWHGYQRSKQLALNAACPSIAINAYNNNCVSGGGADGAYTKDNGSIVVVTAAGGDTLYDINPSDPEAGYFAAWMGNNTNPTFGFAKITVSDSQLSAQFMGTSRGNFSDSFSIVSTPTFPTPTPGASPTATPKPATAITLRSVSTANNATGTTSLTINAPTGTTSGDVMLAQVTVRGATTAITPPSGWALIRRDNTTTSMGAALYYKIVSTPEPSSFTWTFNSTQQSSGGIAAYAGVDNTTPIDASTAQYNDATAAISAPSVTTTAPNDPLVFFAAVTTGTSVTPPPGMALQWIASTAGTTSAMADQALFSAGATGNRVGTSGAPNNSNIGQLVALRPATMGNPIPTPTRTFPTIPTATATPMPTETSVPTPTETATLTRTSTPTQTSAATPTPSPAREASPTATPSLTPTSTPLPGGTLCVLAFNDLNGDSIRDLAEPLLAGAQISVKNSSAVPLFAYITDGLNEPVCFSNLPGDTESTFSIYSVSEINPPGFASTTPDILAVVVMGGFTTNAEFGDQVPPSTPTPTFTVTRTPTHIPTATRTPTRTPTLIAPFTIYLPNPNGMADDPARKRLFITSKNGNAVFAWNEVTRATIATIPVESRPWGVGVVNHRVFVANHQSASVSVIDAATLAKLADLRLDDPRAPRQCAGGPANLVVNPNSNRVYVALYGPGRVAVIDATSNTLIDCLIASMGASGVAINPLLNRLYVSNRDAQNLQVYDIGVVPGRLIQTIPVGGVPYFVQANPNTNQVYVTVATNPPDFDRATSLRVYNTTGNALSLLTTAAIGNTYDGGTVWVSQATGKLFIAATADNKLEIVDPNTFAILQRFPTTDPFAIAENRALGRMYIANRNSDAITVLSDQLGRP